MLANTGPGRNRMPSRVELVAARDDRAGDVAGQQVGGALDPAERATHGAGDDLGEQRLADPGHVLDQQMAARQDARDADLDDLMFAGHDRVDRADEPGRRRHAIDLPVEDEPRSGSVRGGEWAGGGKSSTRCSRPIGPDLDGLLTMPRSSDRSVALPHV